jgi:uncharacterized protein (DUF779 family)
MLLPPARVPQFTPRATHLAQRIKAETPDIAFVFDDTGCCGASNVFVRGSPPAPDYVALTGAPVPTYGHPTFLRTLHEGQRLVVDVDEHGADDSFSLETRYGARFFLVIESAT